MTPKKRLPPVDPSIRSSADTSFPHCWDRKLCYIELQDGVLRHVTARNAVRDAVRRAHRGESQLFCAWPGQWRTDLFIVEDLVAAAKALDVDLSAKAPSPLTAEEVAASQLRAIRIATAEGRSDEVIQLLYKVTEAELATARAIPMTSEEKAEVEAAAAKNVKRRQATEKAKATRARNKAARETAA